MATLLDKLAPTIGRFLAAIIVIHWLCQLGPQSASAEDQAVYVTADESGPEDPDVDLAVALSTDDQSEVDYAAYAEALQAAAEQGIADEAAVAPEEVAPADRAQLEDDISGPTIRQIFRPITEVTIDATLPEGLLPDQVKPELDEGETAEEAMPEVGDPRLGGGWGEQGFEWSASKFRHRPLYFEEVNLERYGYQCRPCLQPFVSGAHFFLTVPTLPYQMTAYPPSECIYTLGHYRPGSRVPWQRNHLPWDARAAAVQAGVTVGLVFLIP